MNKQTLSIAFLILSTAMACGGGSDDSPGGAGGSSAAGSGGSSTAGSGTGGASGGGAGQGTGGSANTLSASMSGKVTDGDGKALTGGRVQMCFKACRTADIGADGSYELPKIEAATHLLEVWPPAKNDLWLAPTFPFTLKANKATTLDLSWLAPDKTVKLPDTAKSVEIADGAHVTIGKDNSSPSLYLAGDFTNVYGVRFLLDHLPTIEGASGTPVGVWVLGPTETKATGDGFPITFDNDQSLADGTELTVWMSEQDDTSHEGVWVSLGKLKAKGASISGDVKLPMLGTVLLTK